MNSKLTAERLARRAIVYVRQSSPGQVIHNRESQRRQYELADRARELGFSQVTVTDDDLGRSGAGLMERPGFQRLVTEVCSGEIGAIFSIEASRLARNGRDWHHLIELCGMTDAVVVDLDGVYDPGIINDRLLLGLKGTMSEFELNLLRQRSLEAIRQKARRGELRFHLPVGLCWASAGKIEIDPDRRVQQAVHLVFGKMTELGSFACCCQRTGKKRGLETSGVQHHLAHGAESDVRRGLRVREDRVTDAGGGRTSTQKLRAF